MNKNKEVIMNKKLGLLLISLLVCSHTNTAGFFRGLAKFTGAVTCGAFVSGGTGYYLKERYPAEQTLTETGKEKAIKKEWKKITKAETDVTVVDTINGKRSTSSEYDSATNVLTVGPATSGIVVQEALEFEKYNLPSRKEREVVTFGISGATAMAVAYPWLRKGKAAVVTPAVFALAGLMGCNYFVQQKHQQALVDAATDHSAADVSATIKNYQELAEKPNVSSIVCLNESPDAGELARILHAQSVETTKKKSGWFG
jgi:hypothetical protein